MPRLLLMTILCCVFAVQHSATVAGNRCQVTPRSVWNAERPLMTGKGLPAAVNFVLIHHTGEGMCRGIEECRSLLRRLQWRHFLMGLSDVGYNFLIDSDGYVYEGRGWRIAGDHADHQFNEDSIGIALIGNFSGDASPTEVSLLAARRVIRCGVHAGHVRPDFILLGHRDVSNQTDCPGSGLYEKMTVWNGFCRLPEKKLLLESGRHVDSICMRGGDCPQIFTRHDWLAGDANESIPRAPVPAQFVVIHHTATSTCKTLETCGIRIREYQRLHIRLAFGDIGYNFLVDSAGHLYEARGWGAEGVHTPGYNRNSLCIAFIGNHVSTKATDEAVEAVQRLIECAVRRGSLSGNFSVVGASDVHSTGSPGSALLSQLSGWHGYMRHVRHERLRNSLT